jgi:hypothetical protein
MFPFCLVVVVDALRSGRALSKRAGTTPSDALHINVQINDNISPKIRPPKKIGPNDKIVRTVRMLALATVLVRPPILIGCHVGRIGIAKQRRLVGGTAENRTRVDGAGAGFGRRHVEAVALGFCQHSSRQTQREIEILRITESVVTISQVNIPDRTERFSV